MNLPLAMALPAALRRPADDVSTLDDADLCVRASRGDDAAFGEIARRHTPALLRMAQAFGLSSADASDAVQDALVKALEKRHFMATVTRVRGWLYRVALNGFLARARKGARQARLLDEHRHDVGPEFQEPLSPRDEKDPELFSRALLSLSPMQRDVMALRAAGLSFAEVARALGSTENACKVHMHHGVKRMRALLEDKP